MFILVLQRLLLESLLDILYFPIWWYTGGFKHAALRCLEFLKAGNTRLAPGLWIKYIFVPMFGQYDWQGRIISFFMRLVNVIGRGIALAFWLFVCLFLLAFWLVFPVIIVFGLSNTFTL